MQWTLLLYFLSVLAADYYEVLGVGRDASDRELKKAYRALSRQFHPDKNRGDENASQKFIEISEAYEILSDPERRKVFDRYGEDGLKNVGASGGFGGMHQDPMDLFQHFFGGMFGQHGEHGQAQRRGHDTMTTLHVPLTDIYSRKRTEFTVQMKGVCDECDGSGSADGHRETCSVCNGAGQRVIRHQLAPGMFQQIQTQCDTCGGKGSVISSPCTVCHGERVVQEQRAYNVFLEPHSSMMWDYMLDGEGDQSPDWIPGNLIVHIVQSSEGNMGFRRHGFDLFRNEVLSATDAVAGGWKRTLTHLDNESEVVLSRAKGECVTNDFVERIEGQGMPKDDDHNGDLYIRYKVVGSVNSANSGHDEL